MVYYIVPRIACFGQSDKPVSTNWSARMALAIVDTVDPALLLAVNTVSGIQSLEILYLPMVTCFFANN